MKTRIAAAVAAVLLGVAAPASIAMAFPYTAPTQRVLPPTTYDGLSTGHYGHYGFDGSRFVGCSSSASEGNANQQTRPVMQYGQTSGGSRC